MGGNIFLLHRELQLRLRSNDATVEEVHSHQPWHVFYAQCISMSGRLTCPEAESNLLFYAPSLLPAVLSLGNQREVAKGYARGQSSWHSAAVMMTSMVEIMNVVVIMESEAGFEGIFNVRCP